MQFFIDVWPILNDAIFYRYLKKYKHRANDASNDGHRTTLPLTLCILHSIFECFHPNIWDSVQIFCSMNPFMLERKRIKFIHSLKCPTLQIQLSKSKLVHSYTFSSYSKTIVVKVCNKTHSNISIGEKWLYQTEHHLRRILHQRL